MIDLREHRARDLLDGCGDRLRADLDADVLHNIGDGGSRKAEVGHRLNLIGADVVTAHLGDRRDHAQLNVEYAADVGGDGDRQGDEAAETRGEPRRAAFGDLVLGERRRRLARRAVAGKVIVDEVVDRSADLRNALKRPVVDHIENLPRLLLGDLARALGALAFLLNGPLGRVPDAFDHVGDFRDAWVHHRFFPLHALACAVPYPTHYLSASVRLCSVAN